MSNHILATALLPHAHESYAGHVQQSVLNALSPFASKASKIVYIPACHQKCVQSFGAEDHSVEYLFRMLDRRYGNRLHIIKPMPYTQRSCSEVVRTIDKLADKHQLVVIGTVDLSHHAFVDQEYPRINKMRAEEETILGLTTLNPSLFNPNFIDAPWSVKIVQQFAPNHGVVVAYDDSATFASNISRHDATYKTMESFVSYVGIVYARDPVPASDKLRDELMLASVKNTIYHSFHRTGLTNKTEAPMWLISLQKGGGVWAGLECGGQTKCSIGRIEVPAGTKHTIALRDSASSCIDDANNRWGGLHSLDNCKYKYERLSRTKRVPWSERFESLNPDTTGITLQLKNGRTATYLPGVWREHWPSKDIDHVLRQLARKAQRGATLEDIDKDHLFKYTTTVHRS